MKTNTILAYAAGLLLAAPTLAFPGTASLLPRGQCASCNKGKSPPPSRPPKSSSGSASQPGGKSSTPARPQGVASSSASKSGGKSPPSRPQGGDILSKSNINRVEIKPPQRGSPSQARLQNQQRTGYKPSSSYNKPPQREKEPRMKWETSRPPTEATVRMPGPGFLTVRTGKPTTPGFDYGKQDSKPYKGPGPKEFKFSDPHKLGVEASSFEGKQVHVTGTGGKAKAGFQYPKQQGLATTESQREGKKDVSFDPSQKKNLYEARTKAYPHESAIGTSQVSGGGAVYLDLSNSPDTTPPQSPRRRR